ncbi:MAG: hypothetical protein COW76_19540 [Shewanella sp. CG18_big_fil_WC_8_21_14_2_50_42_11]|uniref:hypothetical protein n=1 Tax=Shewanella sp. CG18_big_fil_WC_8_21_14_2_50_42_11 TaxID=1975538 RepID=UPI000C629DDA|nr:hypothetical protein [Shewanella sp. CG18_big_fil_WC_8_21_14_2_50_42_11]PIP98712.1 MAG: hypothetical protein COW76_19540 [Shewanella sp. CG18_big_fil_WC_8_21_14_2_50_42_11]
MILSLKEIFIIVVFVVLYFNFSGPAGAQTVPVDQTVDQTCQAERAVAKASCIENGGSPFTDPQSRLVCTLAEVEIVASYGPACRVVKAEIVNSLSGERTVVTSN